MPYIDKGRRLEIDSAMGWDLWDLKNPGELNYFITSVIAEYWFRQPKYQTIAEITGVLENAKQEFYRRIAANYEEGKISTNGDVY